MFILVRPNLSGYLCQIPGKYEYFHLNTDPTCFLSPKVLLHIN